jgi:hypothetical protein
VSYFVGNHSSDEVELTHSDQDNRSLELVAYPYFAVVVADHAQETLPTVAVWAKHPNLRLRIPHQSSRPVSERAGPQHWIAWHWSRPQPAPYFLHVGFGVS